MRRFRRLLPRLTLLSVGLAAVPAFQQAQAATPTSGSSVQVWLTDIGTNQWVANQPAVSFQTAVIV